MTRQLLRHLSIIFLCVLIAACGGRVPAKLPEPLQTAVDSESLGIQSYRQGNYLASIKYFSRAASYYNNINYSNDLARMHINLIQSALIINELTLAQRKINRLEQLIYSAELDRYRDRWLLLKSDYLIRAERYQEAKPILLTISENQGNKRIRKAALINQTIIAVKTDASDVQEYLRQALKNTTQTSTAYARLLRLQSNLYTQQNKLTEAAELCEEALSIYQQRLFQPGIAATLMDLAQISLAQNNSRLASTLLKRALDIRLSIGDRHTAKQILSQLIEIETDLNPDAIDIYQKQIDRLRNHSGLQ